jgi:hypothetical protein
MRELARDLAVSYPTARQRFADLLVRLGLEDAANPTELAELDANRENVLRRLAAGELDLEEAAAMLNLPAGGMSASSGMLAMDGRDV